MQHKTRKHPKQKMQTGARKPFKSGRDRASREDGPALGQDLFWVEGVPALREYLQKAPFLVKRLESFESREKTEAALGMPIPAELPFERKAKKADDPETRESIRAVILHELRREDDFFDVLEKSPESNSLVVVLDHINDPRNLGAIVRSCAFFGVSSIIAPSRRQVLLTQASIATAMGGFAYCRLVEVVNLARFLGKAKERGYWIVGADQGGGDVYKTDVKFPKTMLVLGSEEAGLQRIVREACDLVVAIPGPKERIESLNVSVAAGILLSHLARIV